MGIETDLRMHGWQLVKGRILAEAEYFEDLAKYNLYMKHAEEFIQQIEAHGILEG